jgi:plasmid stabilization system protein ParE
MFEVHYSEVALADLDDIWGYITFELMNPDAAVNTVNGIIDAIDKLSEYPLSGTPLNTLLDIVSDYRFVIYRNYLAFYHLENNAVNIDRVLYEGRDFIKALSLL